MSPYLIVYLEDKMDKIKDSVMNTFLVRITVHGGTGHSGVDNFYITKAETSFMAIFSIMNNLHTRYINSLDLTPGISSISVSEMIPLLDGTLIQRDKFQ